MEKLDHILLFKTDVKTEDCKEKLKDVLDSFEGINQWNIALDDQDHVLRVISYTLTHQQIIELVNNNGHFCCELI